MVFYTMPSGSIKKIGYAKTLKSHRFRNTKLQSILGRTLHIFNACKRYTAHLGKSLRLYKLASDPGKKPKSSSVFTSLKKPNTKNFTNSITIKTYSALRLTLKLLLKQTFDSLNKEPMTTTQVLYSTFI